MDKKYIIDQIRVFADRNNISIDDETLGAIIDASSIRVIPKGKIIASMGDDTSFAGLVFSGMARCYYIDKDGNDITRGFSPAGSLCMDEGFMGYIERLCMWEALEETTIMFCETAAVRKIIRENTSFKDVWICLLENALRYKIYRENGFLVENATERYIRFRKHFPDLSDRIPQKHIATYLGITPESLSRIRGAMREETDL